MRKGKDEKENYLLKLRMTASKSTHTKKIESIFSISHDKDVDGLNSAAIVWRYAKSKDLKHDVILADYGSFEQVFAKVSPVCRTREK